MAREKSQAFTELQRKKLKCVPTVMYALLCLSGGFGGGTVEGMQAVCMPGKQCTTESQQRSLHSLCFVVPSHIHEIHSDDSPHLSQLYMFSFHTYSDLVCSIPENPHQLTLNLQMGLTHAR